MSEDQPRKRNLGRRVLATVLPLFLFAIISLRRGTVETRRPRNASANAPNHSSIDRISQPKLNVSSSNRKIQPNQVGKSPSVLSSATGTTGIDHTVDKPPAKLQLVFHIGPPKTATTFIQESLTSTKWTRILGLDNFTYTGTYLAQDESTLKPLQSINPMLKDKSCYSKLSEARQKYTESDQANLTLSEVLARVPCAEDLLRHLQPYKEKRQSLIISDETLSIRLGRFYSMERPASLDWISLRELLKNDWDISVVITYRRYFEWLPSAKQQVERWKPTKPKLNKWASSGGKAITGLFPDFYKIPAGGNPKMPYYFASGILPTVKDFVPVKLLNMHDTTRGSLLTAFFCDCLFNARRACEASRLEDLDEAVPDKILNAAKSLAYDMLTMAAESLIHANPMPKRHDVVLAAKTFHEQVLNETERDFPLVCPDRSVYEIFLNHSLELEEEILPAFFHTELGEVGHRAAFWKAVDKRKNCHVDTAAVLQDQRWKSFFESQV